MQWKLWGVFFLPSDASRRVLNEQATVQKLTRQANPMSEEHDEEQHGEQLKLTRGDLVLEMVIVLILLAFWGMAFVSLVCPDCFPDWYDQRFLVEESVFFSLFTGFAYWRTRYIMHSWNDKGNSEQQARNRIWSWRICLIAVGLINLSVGLPRKWNNHIFHGLLCVFLLWWICDWYLRRKK